MSSDDFLDFRNAPVTKLLVPIVGGCSALTAAINNNNPQMTSQFNQGFWKLVMSQWAFKGIGTTVVGTWLIYKMRIVERRYGSAKYIAFIFISFVTTTLLQTGFMILGAKYGLKSIASGPYAILFSIIYQFHSIVPPSHSVSMLGTSVSDKSYVFITATQMLLSNSIASVIPCVCGLVVGAIYEASDSLKKWRFPKWARSFTGKYVLPVISSKKTTTKQTTPISASSSAHTRSPPNIRRRQAPLPPIRNEDIDTMFAMFPNYSREDIKNALIESKSDLNRAAEILLRTEPSVGSSRGPQ